MGMWCMFAAPLLISADMDQLDDVSVALLTNANLLAIDQDKGGHQAEFIKSDRNVQVSLFFFVLRHTCFNISKTFEHCGSDQIKYNYISIVYTQ
ncbi:unnamed protein product [Trichobilharzia regenti]|nr:unnamed protein product [Trichobilharzia regenti]